MAHHPLLLLSAALLVGGPVATQAAGRTAMLQFTDFAGFERTAGALPDETVLTSSELPSPIAWNELVVSWNAALPAEGYLHVEARALGEAGPTPYYTMGLWSPDAARHPRESVTGQKNEWAEVQTDTLVLRQAATGVQLRVTLGGSATQLKRLSVSLLDSRAATAERQPNRAAWGVVLPVPERSQVSYPGGSGWCSPTSLTMVLAYWAEKLRRPELSLTVPQVAAGVYDRNWPGTGNWPFNTAFAGAFDGLQAYVARCEGLTDVEDFIARGVPVILSIGYDSAARQPSATVGGHVIVCRGFTAHGDVVVNDPYARLEKGEAVERMFPRQELLAGWDHSRRTAYVVASN